MQVYLSIKVFPRQTDNTVTMVAAIYLRNNIIPARNQRNKRLNANERANPTMVTIQNTTPNRTTPSRNTPSRNSRYY
jgi:hypothetical protein